MLKLLKKLEKKDWLLIIVSTTLIVFQVWLDLKLPDYMSQITQLVQTEGNQVSEILVEGSKMLLCALGSLVAAVIVGYIASYIAASLSKTLRKDIFEKGDRLIPELPCNNVDVRKMLESYGVKYPSYDSKEFMKFLAKLHLAIYQKQGRHLMPVIFVVYGNNICKTIPFDSSIRTTAYRKVL